MTNPRYDNNSTDFGLWLRNAKPIGINVINVDR